jgi:hypothetical protein
MLESSQPDGKVMGWSLGQVASIGAVFCQWDEGCNAAWDGITPGLSLAWFWYLGQLLAEPLLRHSSELQMWHLNFVLYNLADTPLQQMDQSMEVVSSIVVE